jgi:hypothetical protein
MNDARAANARLRDPEKANPLKLLDLLGSFGF